MGDAVTAAFIAGAVALVVSLFSNFGAESYKRYRDSKALAGALAGELGSYREAFPILEERLRLLAAAISEGGNLFIPKIPIPVDKVYECSLEKLGLLGPDLAEGTVYVYCNIQAMRNTLSILSAEGTPPLAQVKLIISALECLQRAATRGEPVTRDLRKFAHMEWLE